MSELAYKLIVDKVIKRKIYILNYLSEHQYICEIDVLANQLKVSKKTLLVSISQINHESIETTQIIFISKTAIALKNNDPFEIHFYIDQLIRDTPLFFILESIYSGNRYTFQELSDILYISESLLRKYLGALRKTLQEYSLNIQLNPINIIGKEADIRFFYFQYFRYAHETSTVPIRIDQLDSIYNTINSIHEDYGVALNIDYNRIAHWLAVFEQRVTLKNFIYIEPKTVKKYVTSTSYLKFKLAFTTHFKMNTSLTNIPEAEIIFAFITRLDSVIYEKNSAFFMDDFALELEKYNLLVTKFLQLNQLHLGINNELKITLQAYLTNLSFLDDLTPLFQKVNEDLHNEVNSSYEEIKNCWYDLLIESEIQFTFPMDIAVNLTLITIAQTKLSKQATIRVLYVFTGEPSAINYYQQLALKSIPQNVEAFFIFNKPLNNKLLKKYSVNICVHNFLPLDNLTFCPSIRLSDVPKKVEWLSLLNLLYSKT